MIRTTRGPRWLCGACVVLAACGAPGPASPPVASPTGAASPPGRHAELASAIDALAAAVLASTPAAGISVAVVWHGEPVVARGYGLADVERKTPAAADTLFRIGSITKQFTAAAILQLAAAHKLALDDDLHRYLPDYPTHGKRITLRNLLAHTSGIRDYEHGIPWLQDHMSEQRPAAELVAQFAAAPLDFEPGARWSYSNSGYFLLGLIIERASGQSFADHVRDHVIAASGAPDVRYCPDEQDYPRAARGYEVKGNARVASRPIKMVYAYAAGGLCASAPGLVAWSRALAHARVVDEASWRQMTTPVPLADGSRFGYGLGLFVGDLGGRRVIFHGGGINGFVSTLAYYPDDDLHVAVLVNTEGNFADDLGEAIARKVLGLSAPRPQEQPTSTADAENVVGRYSVAGVGLTLVIEVEGGELYAHKEGGAARHRLVSQGGGSYALPDVGAQLVFEPSTGKAARIRYTQGGVAFVGERAP